MIRHSAFSLLLLVFVVGSAAADVESGPTPGTAIEKLTVQAITGPSAGKEVDYTAERGKQPTVFVFVPKERFSRPVGRFMKVLDGKIAETSKEATIVAIWLTDDKDATRDYLPRLQQSIKLENTALTYSPGDASGPNGWLVNTDADATVVVVNEGKSVARFGFVSINETVVEDVLKELRQATTKE